MSIDAGLTESQRAAGVQRVAENLALRSGAGCGKTLVLARRFAQLLLESRAPDKALLNFVAVTFTEKAALEMRQRVRTLLAEFAAGATGEKRRRLLAWIEELPEARISTIHGFCAGLLRSHAVAAGVDPNFAVCADDVLAGLMVDEAAEQAVLVAVEAQDQNAAELLTGAGLPRMLRLVAELVRRRSAYDPNDYADPATTLKRWQQLLGKQRKAAWTRLSADPELKALLERVTALPCTDPNDKLLAEHTRIVTAVASLLDAPAARTVETFAKAAVSFRGVGSDRSWGGEGSAKRVRHLLKALQDAVGDYAIYAEQLGPADERAAGILATLMRLAGRANRLYQAEKRRRGMLDFTDLLVRTHALLRQKAPLRKAIGRQIHQLLLDEAQDTDAIQIELLMQLIFDDPAAPSNEEGRLFLVGDGMQSIYRFRGAQVEVFEDLCRRLGENRRQDLEVSFRTHEAGVAFVNHLFRPLMGRDYVPIKAHRTDVPAGASVEIILAPVEAALAATAASDAAQAAATADRIREMIDNKEHLVWDRHEGRRRAVRCRDIAILFARMTHSLAYERRLQERHIPYYVVAGTGFFKRQEVYDVLNALRVVDNPFDDVALFGAMRSGLFGVDDHTLMHLAEVAGPPYFESLPAAAGSGPLHPDQRRAVVFAHELLGRLGRRKNAVGIAALVEELLRETGYEAVLLCQFQGRRMVGNVRLLAERARSADAQGVALAGFLAQTDEMILNESRHEQAAVAEASDDVVRIMTIHKAKGLEFPVVFIPDLNAGRKKPQSDLLYRNDWSVTCRGHGDEGEERDLPLSYRLARALEIEDSRREDLRRLYVAVTRHQDHLVFVGADCRTKDGKFKSRGSYLSQLDAQLGILAAVDAGKQRIGYADGRHYVLLRQAAARPPTRLKRRKRAAEELLASAGSAADLAASLGKVRPRGAATSPLLGPLPATIGRAELAVTALGDFELCPMLYHWRHELAAPGGHQSAGATGPAGGVDAATAGTVYHRCMELLDFDRPQPAAALVARAAGEMDLARPGDMAGMARDLEGMLAGFGASELCGALRRARAVIRELGFVMDLGRITLRGQIDLLYQDEDGLWHVVDYKSDRVGAEGPAEHAGRYQLQLLAYCAAAARRLDAPPADAALYFLRPAATHTLRVTPAAVRAAETRIEGLGADLISSRRSGRFARKPSAACEFCPLRAPCQRETRNHQP